MRANLKRSPVSKGSSQEDVPESDPVETLIYSFGAEDSARDDEVIPEAFHDRL
jgi:hypothetical protein